MHHINIYRIFHSYKSRFFECVWEIRIVPSHLTTYIDETLQRLMQYLSPVNYMINLFVDSYLFYVYIAYNLHHHDFCSSNLLKYYTASEKENQ